MDREYEALARSIEERLSGHAVKRFLDFRIVDLAFGRCSMSIAFRPEFDNTTGAVHGGILSMLADSAAACALASQFGGEMSFATSNLNIHFLRRASTAVTATATVIKTGSRLCVAAVEIHDDAGLQVATATCDFALLDERRETAS